MRILTLIAGGMLMLTATAALPETGGMPARRGGQWEMTMSGLGDQGRSMTMKICVDPATERSFSPGQGPYAHGANSPACSSKEAHPIVGGWAFSSVCSAHKGGSIVSSGTVTGDFRTHLHMVVDTKSASGDHHMVMDQTWLGACPAGGGRTVTLPDGRVINVPSQ
jgi:hypothetical protein